MSTKHSCTSTLHNYIIKLRSKLGNLGSFFSFTEHLRRFAVIARVYHNTKGLGQFHHIQVSNNVSTTISCEWWSSGFPCHAKILRQNTRHNYTNVGAFEARTGDQRKYCMVRCVIRMKSFARRVAREYVLCNPGRFPNSVLRAYIRMSGRVPASQKSIKPGELSYGQMPTGFLFNSFPTI
jgi:hypothetical protein